MLRQMQGAVSNSRAEVSMVTDRRRPGRAYGMVLLGVVVWMFSLQDSTAQQSFATGQTISPAYEGWDQNPEGSFD